MMKKGIGAPMGGLMSSFVHRLVLAFAVYVLTIAQVPMLFKTSSVQSLFFIFLFLVDVWREKLFCCV
jgi:hypothetical protein